MVLRFTENEIKCHGCGNRESYEDVEIKDVGKKQYWICPECFFENPIVNRVVTPMKRAKAASET
jgi:hypothetical protein